LLRTKPSEFFPLFEAAAKEAADQITAPRENAELVKDIHVTVSSQANPTPFRELGADHISKMVKVQGIVVSASTVKVKGTKLTIQCRNCRHVQQLPVKPGFAFAQLPRVCPRVPVSDDEQKCPIDPFNILPDKSICVDQQTIKIQELPESVPTGETPRHLLISCDRYLTNQVVPGTRCTMIGIFQTFSQQGRRGSTPVQQPYLRVAGIELEGGGSGRTQTTFTPDEEEEMLALARDPTIYERLAKSVAPSIWGGENIKKAVACLLFGGAAKRLPDGMKLRGDINVLLLGDPGTAKSQLLKFAEKVAPIAVFTSGKGSSAAGLTASVIRDANSRDFYLEGGAMVLADGGVVCIDEFDKMRESDRVAIHEAMEQQTISIAKAGITTTLNSRTSVLAAANSTFGRWDDTKSTDENIEFQSTILSRFDLIFIVKDEHNEERDEALAKFVMNVHLRAAETTAVEGELSIDEFKKLIQYCRTKCGPRLSEEAAGKLQNHFVQIRGDMHKREVELKKRSAIPITVRQLEAIVRLSESLAKMQMSPFAAEHHVDEALRLFKVSTLDAASHGGVSESDTGLDATDLDRINDIEAKLKRRFPVGARVSEQKIVQDFTGQNYDEKLVRKVISVMIRRGDVEHQMQRRVLYRVK
jgi:DNA replication licensing factor MCM5